MSFLYPFSQSSFFGKIIRQTNFSEQAKPFLSLKILTLFCSFLFFNTLDSFIPSNGNWIIERLFENLSPDLRGRASLTVVERYIVLKGALITNGFIFVSVGREPMNEPMFRACAVERRVHSWRDTGELWHRYGWYYQPVMYWPSRAPRHFSKLWSGLWLQFELLH